MTHMLTKESMIDVTNTRNYNLDYVSDRNESHVDKRRKNMRHEPFEPTIEIIDII